MALLRWDPYLPGALSDRLKPMARLWAGEKATRKDAAIDAVIRALADPQTLKQAIARLQPYQFNAVSLLRVMGGSCDPDTLAIAVFATGVGLPPEHWGTRDADDVIRSLVQQGVVLGDLPYEQHFDGSRHLYADERILAQIGAPHLEPLAIKPIAPPAASNFRRPQAVALDIIGIVQAIARLGGLSLTQSGTVRVADARKVLKALGQTGDSLRVDDMEIPSAASAFAAVFEHCGLLVQQDGRLALAETAESFATLPYAEQARSVLAGFLHASTWNEFGAGADSYTYHRAHEARLALTMALAALPGDGFFSFADFEQALFERIGARFALGYSDGPPSFYYQETAAQRRSATEAWRTKRRKKWLDVEKPWVGQALSTWAYYLGLVELARNGNELVALRLTDLGKSALQPGSSVAVATSPQPDAAAWLLQPTFELIVYLEHATPAQMAFLERNAERVQVQQHVAHYRLTRESVYGGLESGTALDDLLAGLRAGSRRDIPQNVETEIRSWAALREQMTLHRRATLLEYPSAAARDAALRQGIKGKAVAERFILCAPDGAPHDPSLEMIDYTRPLPACFAVNEDGVVTLAKPGHDLLVATQFDSCAERLPSTASGPAWRFSEASVAAAIKSGRTVDDLLDQLSARLIHPVPPLLIVSLHAWSGVKYEAVIGVITILRCTQPAVLAPAVAEALADLVTTGTTAWAIEAFAPERPTRPLSRRTRPDAPRARSRGPRRW